MMLEMLHSMWECLRFSWRWSTSRANGAATILGGFAVLLCAWRFNIEIYISPNTWIQQSIAGVFSVIGAFILLFFVILLFSTFILISEKNCEIADLEAKLKQPSIAPNDKSLALAIDTGNENFFENVQSLENGAIKRELFFRIVNIGSGFLTEVGATRKNISPITENDVNVCMSLSAPLDLGHYRTVCLATFFEKQPNEGAAPDKIMIGWAHGVGYYGGILPHFSVTNQNSPILMEVTVFSRECMPTRGTFKIWVEANTRRLRAEKL